MRILVIEDEIKLAKAIKRALELQHYAVDITHDGEEGYGLASSETFDLIILDLMLPSLDGMQICQQLRAENNSTPILMLTAKGQLKDRVSGLDCGADDYLVKPFSFDELFSRIRALMRRSHLNPTPLLKVKNLTLDPVSLKVERESEEISLSAKEFAILEYLLLNKNKVISKEQLIAHVWNYENDILPSTIEVHIKNLRDKIEKPFHDQLIQTVRGFGYEITDEK